MSSGSNAYDRARAKVENYADCVERYARERCLPAPAARQVDHHLQLTRAEIHALSEDEAAEIALELSNYAYYLQDEVDKVQVRARHARKRIDAIVHHTMWSYPQFRDDAKWEAAARDDDVAAGFLEYLHNQEALLTRLEFLGRRLESVSERFDAVRRTKGNHRYDR